MSSLFDIQINKQSIMNAITNSSGIQTGVQHIFNPKLTLEVDGAGKLEFTIDDSSKWYRSIYYGYEIEALENGVVVFSGRMNETKLDYMNRQVVYCEGKLAYLNDSVLISFKEEKCTPAKLIEKVLEAHNSATFQGNRKLWPGKVYTNATTQFSVDVTYENCMTVLKRYLIDQLGGHLFVRYGARENGNGQRICYIDYGSLSAYGSSVQGVKVAKNLLDFNQTSKLNDHINAIIPYCYNPKYGMVDEDGQLVDPDAKEYLTIEKALPTSQTIGSGTNKQYLVHLQNRHYVYNQEDAKEYGLIYEAIQYDETDDPNVLMANAFAQLKKLNYDPLTVSVSALDLSYTDPTKYPAFKIGYTVTVDTKYFSDKIPITKIEIDMQNGTKKITLGLVNNKRKGGTYGGWKKEGANTVSTSSNNQMRATIFSNTSNMLTLSGVTNTVSKTNVEEIPNFVNPEINRSIEGYEEESDPDLGYTFMYCAQIEDNNGNTKTGKLIKGDTDTRYYFVLESNERLDEDYSGPYILRNHDTYERYGFNEVIFAIQPISRFVQVDVYPNVYIIRISRSEAEAELRDGQKFILQFGDTSSLDQEIPLKITYGNSDENQLNFYKLNLSNELESVTMADIGGTSTIGRFLLVYYRETDNGTYFELSDNKAVKDNLLYSYDLYPAYTMDGLEVTYNDIPTFASYNLYFDKSEGIATFKQTGSDYEGATVKDIINPLTYYYTGIPTVKTIDNGVNVSDDLLKNSKKVIRVKIGDYEYVRDTKIFETVGFKFVLKMPQINNPEEDRFLQADPSGQDTVLSKYRWTYYWYDPAVESDKQQAPVNSPYAYMIRNYGYKLNSVTLQRAYWTPEFVSEAEVSNKFLAITVVSTPNGDGNVNWRIDYISDYLLNIDKTYYKDPNDVILSAIEKVKANQEKDLVATNAYYNADYFQQDGANGVVWKDFKIREYEDVKDTVDFYEYGKKFLVYFGVWNSNITIEMPGYYMADTGWKIFDVISYDLLLQSYINVYTDNTFTGYKAIDNVIYVEETSDKYIYNKDPNNFQIAIKMPDIENLLSLPSSYFSQPSYINSLYEVVTPSYTTGDKVTVPNNRPFSYTHTANAKVLSFTRNTSIYPFYVPIDYNELTKLVTGNDYYPVIILNEVDSSGNLINSGKVYYNDNYIIAYSTHSKSLIDISDGKWVFANYDNNTKTHYSIQLKPSTTKQLNGYHYINYGVVNKIYGDDVSASYFNSTMYAQTKGKANSASLVWNTNDFYQYGQNLSTISRITIDKNGTGTYENVYYTGENDSYLTSDHRCNYIIDGDIIIPLRATATVSSTSTNEIQSRVIYRDDFVIYGYSLMNNLDSSKQYYLKIEGVTSDGTYMCDSIVTSLPTSWPSISYYDSYLKNQVPNIRYRLYPDTGMTNFRPQKEDGSTCTYADINNKYIVLKTKPSGTFAQYVKVKIEDAIPTETVYDAKLTDVRYDDITTDSNNHVIVKMSLFEGEDVPARLMLDDSSYYIYDSSDEKVMASTLYGYYVYLTKDTLNGVDIFRYQYKTKDFDYTNDNPSGDYIKSNPSGDSSENSYYILNTISATKAALTNLDGTVNISYRKISGYKRYAVMKISSNSSTTWKYIINSGSKSDNWYYFPSDSPTSSAAGYSSASTIFIEYEATTMQQISHYLVSSDSTVSNYTFVNPSSVYGKYVQMDYFGSYSPSSDEGPIEFNVSDLFKVTKISNHPDNISEPQTRSQSKNITISYDYDDTKNNSSMKVDLKTQFDDLEEGSYDNLNVTVKENGYTVSGQRSFTIRYSFIDESIYKTYHIDVEKEYYPNLDSLNSADILDSSTGIITVPGFIITDDTSDENTNYVQESDVIGKFAAIEVYTPGTDSNGNLIEKTFKWILRQADTSITNISSEYYNEISYVVDTNDYLADPQKVLGSTVSPSSLKKLPALGTLDTGVNLLAASNQPNIDDLVEPGTYYVNDVTGMPEGTEGWVLIAAIEGKGEVPVRQIFFKTPTVSEDYEQSVFTRILNSSGKWSSWSELGKDSDVGVIIAEEYGSVPQDPEKDLIIKLGKFEYDKPAFVLIHPSLDWDFPENHPDTSVSYTIADCKVYFGREPIQPYGAWSGGSWDPTVVKGGKYNLFYYSGNTYSSNTLYYLGGTSVDKSTKIYFGVTTSTPSSTTKIVTVSDDSFELEDGAILLLHFNTTGINTASTIQINVNDTGARYIEYMSSTTMSNLSLYSNLVLPLVYREGNSRWKIIGDSLHGLSTSYTTSYSAKNLYSISAINAFLGDKPDSLPTDSKAIVPSIIELFNKIQTDYLSSNDLSFYNKPLYSVELINRIIYGLLNATQQNKVDDLVVLSNIQPKVFMTSNLDMNGNKINSGYGNGVSLNRVYRFPSYVDAIICEWTCQTESTSYDWGCIWSGEHSDYTAASNYGSSLVTYGSVTGKAGGSTQGSGSVTVTGNSVTCGFKSDGSNEAYYGFYVKMTPCVYFNTLTADDFRKILYDTSENPFSKVKYLTGIIDFNNITEDGIYIASTHIGNSVVFSNNPNSTGNHGILIHFNGSSKDTTSDMNTLYFGTAFQIFIGDNYDYVWKRKYVSGSGWNRWNRSSTILEVNPSTEPDVDGSMWITT